MPPPVGSLPGSAGGIEQVGPYGWGSGVIAFDSAPVTIVRLQRAANRLKITDSVARLSPGGGTAIFPALDQAYRALSATQAKVKHIILLTDGQSTVRYGDQETMSVSRAGSVGWQRAVALSERHESGNTGDTPLEFLWVNLKQ